MSSSDDPRDPSLESKVTFPRTWTVENVDSLSSSGMFLSGLIMVTKNRFLAWPNLIFAVSSVINQHPLRTKEGSSPPWSSLMLAVSAIIASYMPMTIITHTPVVQ
ncbi:hypothetical protein JAAARDRAFT_36369 [Jaapia argillacea MUCL 33604]|uniref:Uncharacterized protein n=1 Tax=Jaapia argillacea MUCL 33604 TaxID=933084 RepID=A0A067Q061_9AGAM|nr:hypothetical protein JAAARDRAFT_36369 [Jaapia argillacea MUCL 33604]